MSKQLRILLIAGHGAGDPGACSSFGTEATENRNVLNGLRNKLSGYQCSIDVYPTDRNAYADIKNGVCKVNFADYDYVFEIHFNSSSSASATGVEIWVPMAEKGITVEQCIVNKLSSLGFANRGVKKEDFCVIRTAKSKGVSAALVEVCFISNKGDMDRYRNSYDAVCNAMASGIAEGFGLSKNNTAVPPVTNPTPPTTQAKPKYYVKNNAGKQLGAFNDYDNAVTMAKSNSAGIYDINGKLLASYFPAQKEYLNLAPHVSTWRVYPTNLAPIVKNACGSLAPKQFGGLSYQILAKPQSDVYTIQTQSYGKVNIFAPRDNDSSITNSPRY